MRAVVLNGAHDVSVETVDDPVLSGPDGIVVQVERTAICGSDLHLYHGDMAQTSAPWPRAIGCWSAASSAVAHAVSASRVGRCGV